MFRRNRIFLTGLLALLLPGAGSAQSFMPPPSIVRLAWGSIDILVEADTLEGLRIWAIPRKRLTDLSGRFDPVEAKQWLGLAEAVVSQSEVRDSERYLYTPPLMNRDSGMVFLYRERSGKKWSRRFHLLFASHDRKQAFQVPLDLNHVSEFLSVVEHQASGSRVVPRDTLDVPLYCSTCETDTANAPRMLSNGKARYPLSLQMRGGEGRVWATFVITSEGKMDPESFSVLLSDHPDFARATWEMLQGATFRPWRKDGVPTPVRVFQKVFFSTERRRW